MPAKAPLTEDSFEFGRVLRPDELVDRREELDRLLHTMRSGGKVFLIGPRRFGKSSLMEAAAQAARAEGMVVMIFDTEAFPDLSALMEHLVATSASQLTSSLERAGKAVLSAFARLKPQLTLDPQTSELSVSLGLRDGDEPVPLLAESFDAVETLARESGKRVVIMLDEFQRIVMEGGERAEAQIRSAVQHHSHVAYVFAGSNTRMLRDMTSDPQRPFYKLGDVCTIGALPREEFRDHLVAQYVRLGILVEDGAVDDILDYAHEVPYNVQLLAHGCWEACRANIGRPGQSIVPLPLTRELVARATRTAAMRADPFYSQLWTSLTNAQQRTLLAFIREGGVRLTSSAVAAQYRVPVPTLSKSLRLLENKGILREDFAHGTRKLTLEDPLFGVWIRNVIN